MEPCRPAPLRIALADADATIRLGARLAGLLGAGDALLLEGPIGAGKTLLARALIQARLAQAGRTEDVPSPTFTLVQVYDAAGLEIWHADLYRLTHPDEAVELGLEDAFREALCIVEWPDRLGALRPARALTIRLEDDATQDGRLATIRAPAELAHLRDALSWDRETCGKDAARERT